MSTLPTPKLRIFYDGGCKVCAWEVNKYLAQDHDGRLGTIDINAPGFEAERYGLDSYRVRRYFHVLTSEGRVIAGVDAFIEIWKTLDTPLSARAAKLARLQPIHWALRVGYQGFIRVRPYLPRNPISPAICDDGSCALHPPSASPPSATKAE
jgi:predicted DCC family thiol-disulfide oxidoreductase YuxK